MTGGEPVYLTPKTSRYETIFSLAVYSPSYAYDACGIGPDGLVVVPRRRRRAGGKPEQRTLFMYFPWSTNLTDYFYDNILAMEEAIAKTGLDNERVIVFISTSSSEAEMFEITCNGGKCTRTELKTYDNPSLTTAAGISGILSDMKTFAPADVYAMTIGCHGMGWLPVESKYKAKGQAPAFVPHYSVDKGYAMTRYFGGVTSDDQMPTLTIRWQRHSRILSRKRR